jgi:L-ribulokinase
LKTTFVIGLDFGTDSVRAVLMNSHNRDVLATEIHYYKRWKSFHFCQPIENQYRQHPQDHIEGMEQTILAVLKKTKINPEQIKAIGIDTTGSSPLPLTKEGHALAFEPGFENNPNAMMILWKDHTAILEALEINQHANSLAINYLQYVGGIYSSEWFWAKILHVIRKDKNVKEHAYTWMEHCDYMSYILVKNKDLSQFKRSRCAAGHKALWHTSWGGLPPEDFLNAFDPYLGKLRKRLYTKTYTSDEIAGTLDPHWAKKLGLTENTVIAVGTFDAHAGAVGADIKENTLIRVMGTSTCDILVSSKKNIGTTTVRGICGQVEGSVLPNWIGLEAGQSAFGDVLAWFKSIIDWPMEHFVFNSSLLTEEQKNNLKEAYHSQVIEKLTQSAQSIHLEEALPVALDWINGRRTPDADQTLKGAISNLNLGTKTPHLFLALIHSICFGSKLIVDRFIEEGIKINNVVGIGGVAKKNPFIMQTLANVLNCPVQVADSEQTPALGAAIYASVAAGLHPTVEAASKIMSSTFVATYIPEKDKVKALQPLQKEYVNLGIAIEKLTHTSI